LFQKISRKNIFSFTDNVLQVFIMSAQETRQSGCDKPQPLADLRSEKGGLHWQMLNGMYNLQILPKR